MELKQYKQEIDDIIKDYNMSYNMSVYNHINNCYSLCISAEDCAKTLIDKYHQDRRIVVFGNATNGNRLLFGVFESFEIAIEKMVSLFKHYDQKMEDINIGEVYRHYGVCNVNCNNEGKEEHDRDYCLHVYMHEVANNDLYGKLCIN